MNYFNRKTSFFLGLVGLFIAGSMLFTAPVYAETEFIVNWQAKTYVPAWYSGKAFPTNQSFTTVAFELLENGRIVDLSKAAVRWHVDGKLLKNETNGLGLRQITIFNKKYAGDVSSIKITLPDYRGQALVKAFDIPIKSPEVVVDIPYAQKKVARGENVLYAWPFFFTVESTRELALQWKVDGNTTPASTAEDPRLLFLTGNGGKTGGKSTVEATVTNREKVIERVIKRVFVELP